METIENDPMMPEVIDFAVSTAPIRFVTHRDDDGATVFVLADDICRILDVDPGEALSAVPQDKQATFTIHERNLVVDRVAVTVNGVKHLAHTKEDDPTATRLVEYVEKELRTRRPGNSKPSPHRTKWGWQPLRHIIKSRGYTARRFTQEANELNLPEVGHFNYGNYVAWSYGACLPTDALIKRASALLDLDKTVLFTSEVLAAYPTRGRGHRFDYHASKDPKNLNPTGLVESVPLSSIQETVPEETEVPCEPVVSDTSPVESVIEDTPVEMTFSG